MSFFTSGPKQPRYLRTMETIPLKSTALHEAHLKGGAKMVPFAGYNMPVQYRGLKLEHQAVRQDVGMFDVSHMGEFMVEGPDAEKLIQWISTNDVSTLKDGKVQYSCMPNASGGIVDDMLVYRLASDSFMLVVNASNREKDWNWIQEQVTRHAWDVRFRDESEHYVLLAVQGPNAQSMVERLGPERIDGLPWSELAYYTFTQGHLMGHEVVLSATGYTGSGGLEIYMPLEAAAGVWDALLTEGAVPCGLGARDTLRMEMGYCLYGNDLDDNTSPISAGLGWITKFTKDFVSKETLQLEKAQGPSTKLVGIVMDERGIPRHDYVVKNANDAVVGKVTSGTMSPSLGHGIGMAYIDASHAQPGTSLLVEIRNKSLACHVVRFPFYKG